MVETGGEAGYFRDGGGQDHHSGQGCRGAELSHRNPWAGTRYTRCLIICPSVDPPQSVHKVLEREVKPEEILVEITTPEERWGLR